MFYALVGEESQLFDVRIHYGGNFDKLDYVGGDVHYLVGVGPNLIAFSDIVDTIKALGYPSTTLVWYYVLDAVGLQICDGDIDLLELFESHAAANKYSLDLFIQASDLLPVNLNMDDMNVGGEGNNRDMDDMDVGGEENNSDISDFDYFAEGDTLSDG